MILSVLFLGGVGFLVIGRADEGLPYSAMSLLASGEKLGSFSLLFSSSSSGGGPCKKGRKAYEEARRAIQRGAWREALVSLRRLLQKCPDFVEAYAVMGDIFQSLERMDSALRYYRLAIERGGDRLDPTIFYLAGKTAYQSGEYGLAVEYLARFLEEISREEVSEEMYGRVERLLENARVARRLAAHPVSVQFENLGPAINTSYHEYFPAITVDERVLLFTRRVRGQEDFYVSVRAGRWLPWGRARPVGPPINTPYNEGAQALSPDGRFLIFTACNREDGLGRCDLYWSEVRGGRWQAPVNLGAPVNTAYWESQPTIGPDSRTVIFSSDRPGGYGGLDLWWTMLTDTGWIEPRNLDTPINTVDDEFSPFLHPDGRTLYFASRGHPGMGKADLFVSWRRADGGWTRPKNLGYPINTINEESGLIVGPSGKDAYFASDRPGGFGGLDLYRFTLPEGVRARPVTCVEGLVRDKETRQPVAASVFIVDVEDGDTAAHVFTDGETGRFLLPLPAGRHYGFYVQAPGYLFYSEHYFVPEIEVEDTLPIFRVEVLLARLKPGERIILRNIFFETGSASLSSSSRYELDKVVELLRMNPGLEVEIAGHTDDVGPSDYNQRLSEARAKAVYDYLVAKGVDPSRLTYKGYGETQPLVRDTTEWARARNRRTELRIRKAP